MDEKSTWNPLTEWKHTDIKWVRVDISKEDLGRFTKRSDIKGLAHAIGFLILIAATATLSFVAFSQRIWILLPIALYIHGTFYSFFGNSLHELSHNTVFRSRWLNVAVTTLFGILHWPYNPHFYRLSHQKYHHRYTLHQGSDGEDTPNYVEITPKLMLNLFLRVFEVKTLLQCLYRLFTFRPLSKGWRGRGFNLDSWEQFIFANASPRERRQVVRLGAASLIIHVAIVVISILTGYWFIPILVTFAPFYGAGFLGFAAGIHQHAACEANDPDFRISCGDAILDPLSSFLYWRMEYHIEHHMFAAIPCYNLKNFSRFVADQLPPKEYALPRIRKLHQACKERFGSYQAWRDEYGFYKGF